MKVVRSSSEILALIKSCDDLTKDVFKDVQHASHSIENSVVPHLQIFHNSPKKILKPLGTKNIFKSNLNVSPKVTESKDQESKVTVNLLPNNIRSKKLVLF